MHRLRPLVVAVLGTLWGCGTSTPPAVEPSAPPASEPPAPQPEPDQARAPDPDPCGHLDPHVFDVEDIRARTDITDAKKEELLKAQAERRRVLNECFVRAMEEEKAGAAKKSGGGR